MTQDAADRSKRVLAALVREYIASGEPVASSLLVTAAGLGVSSATVRSILARLEEVIQAIRRQKKEAPPKRCL